MTKYTIWPATKNELPIVMDLLCERVKWLQKQGSDQWSTYARWEPEMVVSIREGRTFLLRESGGAPIGTMTSSTEGDTDFWTNAELETPALYLSKLATHTDYAGRGLGSLMLEYAMYCARAQRQAELRIDVWRTAHKLHRYYLDHGWTYLRTVDHPGRFSGTLFYKPVDIPSVNRPPTGLEVRPPGGAQTPSPEEPGRHSAATFAPGLHDTPGPGGPQGGVETGSF